MAESEGRGSFAAGEANGRKYVHAPRSQGMVTLPHQTLRFGAKQRLARGCGKKDYGDDAYFVST